MGTKSSPGKFDCYAAAEPDEPMFILLGRDLMAQYLVAAWTALRAGDLRGAVKLMLDAHEAMRVQVEDENHKEWLPYNSEKSVEAQQCSRDMRCWYESKLMNEIEKRLGGAVKT